MASLLYPKETSLRVERAIIWMGILSAPVTLAYTFMVYLGIVPAAPESDPHSMSPFYISLALIIVGQGFCLLYQRMRSFLGSYVIICHLIVAIYAYFVSGFISPIILYWAPLFIVSLLYFGPIAGVASGSLMLALGAAISFNTGDPWASLLVNSFWTVGVMVIGGLIVVALRGINLDQREINSTREILAKQQDRTLTLINNLADAIVSTDINGEILVYNAALLNLLDTNANLEAVNISDILKLKDTSGKSVNVLEVLASSNAVKVYDNFIATIGGEPLRLEITCSAIHSGYLGEGEHSSEVSGYIIILRDVTKAKSLEEERDEFISVVSHELRTPITIAEGTLSNAELMAGRADIAKEKLTESISLAHSQIVFLARMVNDLSTLSRAERGVADDTEDIDVAQMVHDLYNEYQPQAAEKNLRFDIHMPGKIGHVNASRLYLKELLQNFVTNAIKYTKEGSVSVTVKHTEDNKINFTVKDSGIGISKSDQKRIFEKFYRAEDYRTRETSGTGLGLYVATKLARKLGTKIEMKSRLNHGSSFSIELPVSNPPKR